MGARSWPIIALTFLLALATAPARALTYDVTTVPSAWIASAGHTVISAWASGLGCPDTRRRRQSLRAARSRLLVPPRCNQLYAGAREHERSVAVQQHVLQFRHCRNRHSTDVSEPAAEHEPQQLAADLRRGPRRKRRRNDHVRNDRHRTKPDLRRHLEQRVCVAGRRRAEPRRRHVVQPADSTARKRRLLFRIRQLGRHHRAHQHGRSDRRRSAGRSIHRISH